MSHFNAVLEAMRKCGGEGSILSDDRILGVLARAAVDAMTPSPSAGDVAKLVEELWRWSLFESARSASVLNQAATALESLSSENAKLADLVKFWIEDSKAAHETKASLSRDLAEAREALERCRGALAMMIDPEQVKQTSVAHAFAEAVAAEARARSLTQKDKSDA